MTNQILLFFDITLADDKVLADYKISNGSSLEVNVQVPLVKEDNSNSSIALEEGTKVEANYKGRGRYFAAKVRQGHGDGTYDIEYDDGETEENVKEEYIRLRNVSRKARFEEGTKVEANYKGRGRYFAAKVRQGHGMEPMISSMTTERLRSM